MVADNNRQVSFLILLTEDMSLHKNLLESAKIVCFLFLFFIFFFYLFIFFFCCCFFKKKKKKKKKIAYFILLPSFQTCIRCIFFFVLFFLIQFNVSLSRLFQLI